MMEAGSKLEKDSLVKIYYELKNNKNLGSLCGYQEIEIQNRLGIFDGLL